MGGGKKVTYNPPKIERDKSFEKYLEYQMKRDKDTADRAAKEKAEAKAAKDARNKAGAAGYDAYASNIQSQLKSGLISFNDAQSRLEGYRSKYEISPGKKGQELSDYYVKQLLPGRRETGTKAAYEEILGRAATADELKKAKERFGSGYYSSVKDLKDSLYKGQEYQKKFNKSYLENYYDTQFGKQTTDAKGERTGKRTFTFDKSLLPKYSGNLQGRSGITTPSFKDSFTGTPAEIQEQLQNVRDTRQYLYSAGLTNLQGEINKETTKLKSEGAKQLQKIKEQGGVYRSLIGSFSF
jgi:ubiquitin